jgi:UDP-GlcNAc:undecaprenyl-phosphate GlcNAc-1-phosphate transferase
MLVTESDLLMTGVIGAVTAAILTPLVAALARRWRVLDQPQGYKAHPVATPLLGGLSVAAATGAAILVVLSVGVDLHLAGLGGLSCGTAVILIGGLLDDYRPLRPQNKFAVQLTAAAAAGLMLALLGVRLSLFLPWPPAPIIILTVFWVVGITNALNLMDNMNGLCAGIGAVAAAALALVNLRSGEATVALSAAALAGACCGFLPYNWPHARIFLGDVGSMFIGFSLAALSVMGVYTRGAEVPVLAVFTPVCLLAVPILDTLSVVVLRLRKGHPPWVGDRRHLSHRFVRRGMPPAVAVAVLWMLNAVCALAAVMLRVLELGHAALLVVFLGGVLVMVAVAAGDADPT